MQYDAYVYDVSQIQTKFIIPPHAQRYLLCGIKVLN